MTDGVQASGDGDKSAAWYTAFFYLAEHVREATFGAMNHKSLYALIGLKGHYINHSNPMVRKRTAGTLSRIVHTKRYAQDMRNAFLQDDEVFDRTSEGICEAICAAQGFSGAELGKWLVDTCWPDIRRGLVNEAGEWRRELNISRVDCEMSMLFASCLRSCEGAAAPEVVVVEAEKALSAMLYIMAFDHLDTDWSRLLVDQGFPGDTVPGDRILDEDRPVYLIGFADSSGATFTGIWTVSKDRSFVIGRYTDCDVFEHSREVARIHCRIYWEGKSWHLEDMGSSNGSVVRRGSTRVHVAQFDGAENPFRLEFGDAIELPGGSTYLFAASVA